MTDELAIAYQRIAALENDNAVLKIERDNFWKELEQVRQEALIRLAPVERAATTQPIRDLLIVLRDFDLSYDVTQDLLKKLWKEVGDDRPYHCAAVPPEA